MMGENQKTGVLVKESIAQMKGMNKTNALTLMENYGSLKEMVLARDYNEFLDLEGIGPGKVRCLLQMFRGDFNSKE